MNKDLISDTVASAVAAFFVGMDRPYHSAVTRVLAAADLNDGYASGRQGQGPNRETRVMHAFELARQRGDGRILVEGLLLELRDVGLIGHPEPERTTDEQKLHRALGRAGWILAEDGRVWPSGVELDSGGREVLDEQLARLRAGTDDPALQIGIAKDLLESAAKLVLKELDISLQKSKPDFGDLWHAARMSLGVHPTQVDTSLPGFEEIRDIHTNMWNIAKNVNSLRLLQGTGHGSTLPSGVPEELALMVAREACSVAEYMLRSLDRQRSSDT